MVHSLESPSDMTHEKILKQYSTDTRLSLVLLSRFVANLVIFPALQIRFSREKFEPGPGFEPLISRSLAWRYFLYHFCLN